MIYLPEIDPISPSGIPAYWFSRADADGLVRLGHGDGRVVRVGEVLTVAGPPRLCEYGLHASRRVLDALQYGRGPILACVRLAGAIVEGNDKLAATARETVWLGDVSAVLRVFACNVAERALLRERAAGREPDPRSWAAIAVTRQWIVGDVGGAALASAKSAAWAAYAAAYAAAEDAAWDAAAHAAWGASHVATRGAAEDAAHVAAWGAAEDVTRDDERAWQEAHLRDLLRAGGVPVWAVSEEDS